MNRTFLPGSPAVLRTVWLLIAALLGGSPGGQAQTPPSGGAPASPAVLPAPIPAPQPGGGAAPATGPSPGGFRQAPTRLRPAPTTPVPNPGLPSVAGAPAPAAGAAGDKDSKEGEPNITAEEVRAMSDDDPVTLNLPNAPLDVALEIYSGLVRRVLLRPPQLAGGPINLKFEDLTREEAIEAMNAVLALNAISVLPVGEKFVKVVPSQQAVQEGAKATDQTADEFSELGQFITKMVKVTKVKPGDIAQAVQQFASGKVQNPVLVFDDQNFFILRDMSANVKRMVELIKELDVTVELDYKLEVIPIRYGRVDEIFETLNSVVTGSSSGGMGTSGGRSGSRLGGFNSGTGAGGVGGAGGIGNTGLGGNTGFGNSGLSSRSGTAGRTGSGMTSPGAGRSSLQDRLRQVSSAATGGGGGAGGQFNLVGEARIIPNVRANSLIVYANKEDFKMLTNIVAKIDTLLAQVLIESIILEVSLDKNKDFGFSMAQNPQRFGGGWSGAGGSVNDAAIATNLVSSMFPGGFSYFGQYKNDFAVALTAVATDSRARVLARPRIQTTHAQEASFRIGDTVPYPRSSQAFGGISGGYQPFTTYDERAVLTELAVTPYITPDGLVTLEVEQTIDQLGPTTKIGQDEIPTIRTRSASAVLSVRDGEPVILGGFITDRQTDSTSGVPWLKDIPLLGWAFRSKSDFKQQSELIVLIKPTILNTPQDASKLATVEQRSLPNATVAVRDFQREEAAMAERLGVVPGSTNAPAVDPEPTKSSKRKSSRRAKGE